jgi:hypothetical protein
MPFPSPEKQVEGASTKFRFATNYQYLYYSNWVYQKNKND